jgi:hypothetical protein
MGFLDPITTSAALDTTPTIAEVSIIIPQGPFVTTIDIAGPVFTTTVGVPGPKGDPGSSYNFTQSVASASWAVNHGLNKYPSVSVRDSTGELVECDIVYIDFNNLTINAEYPFTGTAYII